jgi:hypothetical protein
MVFSGGFFIILRHDGLAAVAIHIGHHSGHRCDGPIYAGIQIIESQVEFDTVVVADLRADLYRFISAAFFFGWHFSQ